MPFTLEQLARQARPVSEIGGKASHLAALVAAGARVPPGVVIAAGEPLDEAALAAIAGLGESFAVRSSSPLEDRAEHAAPGLFPSVVDVALDQVAGAFVEVRDAADSELARAYAAATNRRATPAMGVIVQRYIEPKTAGTAYSRAPGRPGVMLIEPRGEPVVEIERGQAPPRWSELAAAVEGAERAIAARGVGADVEWVEGADGLWLVQARPLRPAPLRARPPDELFDFATSEPARRWRLDLRHNPEPLSPAQRGLVELVIERNGAPLALAGGYLYEAIDDPAPERAPDGDLESLFFAGVEPDLDARLADLEQRPPDLERALELFAAVHRDYGEVTAALAAARRRCGSTPGRLGTARAHAIALAGDDRARRETRDRAARLAALSAGAFYGCYAAAWDVAAPPLEGLEVDDRPVITPPRPEASAEIGWLADLRTAIAELDDRLFYRAQALVRRALLARGDALGVGDDALWLPLALVRSGEGLDDASERAQIARLERERARQLSMPLEISGDRRVEPDTALDRPVLRGRGFGGRAAGPVALMASGARAIEPGAVAVAVDMTPADVIAARSAAAIALEAGSLLGHAAAMARELDIPIVVQIPGLCRLVRERDSLAVDGERGLVLRDPGR